MTFSSATQQDGFKMAIQWLKWSMTVEESQNKLRSTAGRRIRENITIYCSAIDHPTWPTPP